MMADRLQAAWRYTAREIWQPLFKRFLAVHPDLPIEIVRAMLVRPRNASEIFVPPGRISVLDSLRADVATFLDQPEDAKSALRRIKPNFFCDGRAVAVFLTDVASALREYDNPDLDAFYVERIVGFLQRHALPCRLVTEPFRLVPLLHREVDALYSSLRARAAVNNHLQEALSAFEDAWDRQSINWNQSAGKEAIRAASLLAENMLVAASGGRDNEFTRALVRMRTTNRFPSNDFANIFDRAYTFANNYPNIRHPGDAACVKRDLRREDAVLMALVFFGLSACVHDLCADDS